MLSAEIRKDRIVITCPADFDLPLSRSGKMHTLCCSKGIQPTDLQINGMPMWVTLYAGVATKAPKREQEGVDSPVAVKKVGDTIEFSFPVPETLESSRSGKSAVLVKTQWQNTRLMCEKGRVKLNLTAFIPVGSQLESEPEVGKEPAFERVPHLPPQEAFITSETDEDTVIDGDEISANLFDAVLNLLANCDAETLEAAMQSLRDGDREFARELLQSETVAS